MLKTLFALSFLLLSSSAFAHKWCDLQETKEIQDYCYVHVIEKAHADEQSQFEDLTNAWFYGQLIQQDLRATEYTWEQKVRIFYF